MSGYGLDAWRRSGWQRFADLKLANAHVLYWIALAVVVVVGLLR